MSSMTLEEAALALNGMTPEAYLEVMDYVESLELRQGLPEAPSSVNFRMNGADGGEAQFTLRDWDENNLLVRFKKLLDLTKSDGAQAVVSRQQIAKREPDLEVRITSEVAASVIEGENVERFEVSELEFNRGNKTDFVMVKGGVWMKFGWRAYPEVIPTSVSTEDWTPGESHTNVPPEMKYAYVDKTDGKRKIVAFAQ